MAHLKKLSMHPPLPPAPWKPSSNRPTMPTVDDVCFRSCWGSTRLLLLPLRWDAGWPQHRRFPGLFSDNLDRGTVNRTESSRKCQVSYNHLKLLRPNALSDQQDQQLRGGVEQEVCWSCWPLQPYDLELPRSCQDGAVSNRREDILLPCWTATPQEEEGLLGQGHCHLLHCQPTASLRWTSYWVPWFVEKCNVNCSLWSWDILFYWELIL